MGRVISFMFLKDPSKDLSWFLSSFFYKTFKVECFSKDLLKGHSLT